MKKVKDFNDFKKILFYIYEELIYIDNLYLLYDNLDRQPELSHTDLFDAKRKCCVDSYILAIYKLFDINSALNIFSIIEYVNKNLSNLDCEFQSLIDWNNQENKYLDKQYGEYYNALKKIKRFRDKVIAHADIKLIKSSKFEKTTFIEYWKLTNLAKDVIDITIKNYNIELDVDRLKNHVTYKQELHVDKNCINTNTSV